MVTGIFVALDLPTNSGVGIGILVASAAFVGAKFARDKGRVFSRSERLRITGLSFMASLAISLLLFAGFVFMMHADSVWYDMALTLQQLSWPLAIGIVAFVTAIYLLGLYVSFGLIAKQVLKAEQRKEQA